MSLLGGIGNWLRKEVDNVGSFVTGQPAHGPAPPPPQPQIQHPGPSPATQQLMIQHIASLPGLNVNNSPNTQKIGVPQSNPNGQNASWNIAPPPRPNLIHQAINLGHRNIVNPLVSADKFILNNTGLTDAAKASGIIPSTEQQRLQSANTLVRGAVKFPIQAGQQLANTGLQLTHTIPNDVHGTAPSLQHQFSQIKKSNGTLPAALQTGFSGAMDVAPLLGGIKSGAPKVAEVSSAIKAAPIKVATSDPRVLAYDHQYGQLQKAYDNANSANLKLNLNKAMSNNRVAREQTFQSINQGGYAKVPIGRGLSFDDVPGVPAERPSPTGKSTSGNRGISLQKAPELPIRVQSEAGNLPKGTKLLQIQGKEKPEQSALTNYTTNPTEVHIPEVNIGDYGKARSNAQLASAPIEYAAGQVARTARTAKLSTSKLGRLVEGTDKPANATETEAIKRYRQFADRVHATSEALGGKTPYRPNYFHHEWDLSNPEMANKFEAFRQRKFGSDLNPTQFEGLDTQPRVFDTVAQGEAAGFKLKKPEAASDILDYGKGSAYALKRQALAKGFMEADQGEAEKLHSFDMGQGKTLALSDKGLQEIRAFDKTPQAGKPLKIYRGANRKLKQTLLSASEFHPINITKKVAPGIALEGHPVLATKGAYGAFRAQLGKGYSDKLQQQFQEKGLVDFGARVGSPIKFGSDYATEGKLDLGHAGIGEKTIFEKSMPALHGRALEALQSDLDKKNISYDSPEARAAGTRVNEMMGFVNTEVRNLDKGHQKFLGDVALAPQFTRAKWATIKSALKDKGVAGSYARRAILGETLATATAMLALGYLAHQKSDNIKDLIIRTIVHPSVPTPAKDKKGNNIELGMPSTFTSEALGLVANITRNKDGHLGVTFKPSNLPGNVANYGRARLAILPGAGLKVATNTDYANKPLYDPNAPVGTKVQQGATTVLGGTLPIGTQGALETNAIKQHLPQGVQQVLEANTPGSNPLIKSIGSSFGLTPRTDKTVGKGLQTTQYFDALNKAKSGLDANDKAAFDSIHQQSKNPVTGDYVIQPSVFDSEAKGALYLQHPNVLSADTKLNQTLASQGQAIDPFFNLPSDQQKAYLEHTLVNKNNTQQLTVDQQRYKDWLPQFQQDRSVFFNSLPPGDPNKPKNPIQPPVQTADVQAAFQQYDSIQDPTQRGTFFAAHPELASYEKQSADYTNKVLVAQGLTPLKPFPEADANTASYTSAYMKGDKAQRTALRTGNPQGYQNMQAYLQNVDEYEVAKNGALDQLQGQTPNQKLLKGISSLANYDIVKNPDGTLALKYGSVNPGATTYGSVSATAQPGAVSNSSFGGSSYHKYAKKQKAPFNPIKKYRKINIKHTKKPRIFLKKPPSSIKIKNKVNDHVGIKSKTYI